MEFYFFFEKNRWSKKLIYVWNKMAKQKFCSFKSRFCRSSSWTCIEIKNVWNMFTFVYVCVFIIELFRCFSLSLSLSISTSCEFFYFSFITTKRQPVRLRKWQAKEENRKKNLIFSLKVLWSCAYRCQIYIIILVK